MGTEPLPFVRALRLGSHGPAVEACKRGVYRFLDNGRKWTGFVNQTQTEKRLFGPFFRRDLIQAQHLMTVGRDGWVDEPTLRGLEQYMDEKAKGLWLQQFAPKPPTLIEPKQGFASLTEELWQPYTIGRRMGLSDLGTYNPASKLPSGSPSDHSVYPAYAFDLGFSPQTGFAHPVAHKFFNQMAAHTAVHYVILGDRIWSREKLFHAYTAGGHGGHVHVSGVHS